MYGVASRPHLWEDFAHCQGCRLSCRARVSMQHLCLALWFDAAPCSLSSMSLLVLTLVFSESAGAISLRSRTRSLFYCVRHAPMCVKRQFCCMCLSPFFIVYSMFHTLESTEQREQREPRHGTCCSLGPRPAALRGVSRCVCVCGPRGVRRQDRPVRCGCRSLCASVCRVRRCESSG